MSLSLPDLLLFTCIVVLSASAALAAQQITSPAEARAWIERTFAANGCSLSLDDFRAQMVADGVAPGPADFGRPFIGTDKLIRQNFILRETQLLAQEGGLQVDLQDGTHATSTFGGCAE